MKKLVFEYTNYRDYLKAFYEYNKALVGYTYRDFAKKAGMNSPSWLLQLIKGTKNLSELSAIKVGRALELNKRESEYFELLVPFTQAKTNELKGHYYEKMLALKKRLKLIKLSEEQLDIYSKWYHPVIRSLVTKVDFADNYEILANKLLPTIKPSEAKKSVALLEKTGFIKKNKLGKWEIAKPIMTTGDEVSSLKVMNYHKDLSRLASEVFDRSTREERDISALTLGIDKEGYDKLKVKIRQFRKEILDTIENCQNPNRVYQMNLHFFPVSKGEE